MVLAKAMYSRFEYSDEHRDSDRDGDGSGHEHLPLSGFATLRDGDNELPAAPAGAGRQGQAPLSDVMTLPSYGGSEGQISQPQQSQILRRRAVKNQHQQQQQQQHHHHRQQHGSPSPGLRMQTTRQEGYDMSGYPLASPVETAAGNEVVVVLDQSSPAPAPLFSGRRTPVVESPRQVSTNRAGEVTVRGGGNGLGPRGYTGSQLPLF